MRRYLLVILLGIVFFVSCQPETPVTYKLTILPVPNAFGTQTGNNKSIKTELADNEQSRVLGLKYRTSLAPDSGMLFAYSDERTLNFWMKDTSIPLSIAFIKSDGSILEIRDMEQFSLESIASSAPARYALEANRDWFKDNQVKPGDNVIFPASLNDRLRKQ